MDQELTRIIKLFNAVQERAVNILESKFNCPRPDTSEDFILRCAPIIRAANYESSGYKIRPHGIGMEISVDGTKIDFDFGASGEFNGFDAWRLFNFINENRIKSSFQTEAQIEHAIEMEIEKGHIVKGSGMGSVCYVNS